MPTQTISRISMPQETVEQIAAQAAQEWSEFKANYDRRNDLGQIASEGYAPAAALCGDKFTAYLEANSLDRDTYQRGTVKRILDAFRTIVDPMLYILTDREDKDRTDPIIDSFTTCEAAEAYKAELGYGTVEVWESVEAARGGDYVDASGSLDEAPELTHATNRVLIATPEIEEIVEADASR